MQKKIEDALQTPCERAKWFADEAADPMELLSPGIAFKSGAVNHKDRVVTNTKRGWNIAGVRPLQDMHEFSVEVLSENGSRDRNITHKHWSTRIAFRSSIFQPGPPPLVATRAHRYAALYRARMLLEGEAGGVAVPKVKYSKRKKSKMNTMGDVYREVDRCRGLK